MPVENAVMIAACPSTPIHTMTMYCSDTKCCFVKFYHAESDFNDFLKITCTLECDALARDMNLLSI